MNFQHVMETFSYMYEMSLTIKKKKKKEKVNLTFLAETLQVYTDD